ncbi:MAG: hypothetical protein AAF772_10665 [Acidobacteriota bacterium]
MTGRRRYVVALRRGRRLANLADALDAVPGVVVVGATARRALIEIDRTALAALRAHRPADGRGATFDALCRIEPEMPHDLA